MSDPRRELAKKILEVCIEAKRLPKTRQLSIAVTRLEEAFHWVADDAAMASISQVKTESPVLKGILEEVFMQAFGWGGKPKTEATKAAP